jgi:hypothetical protein
MQRKRGNVEARKRGIINKEINPSKPKLLQIIFKNSVRTARKTPHLTIAEISLLTLFTEIIAVYTGNHTKSISKKRKVNDC